MSASTTAKMVATLWHCHRPVAACDLQGLFREGSRDSLLGQHFENLIGARPESRLHRLLEDLNESIATFVAFIDQPCDDAGNVGHRLVHVGCVLAAEVHDLDRVPDDMILTHGLEPKRLYADGAFADFRVPHKETRCKRLAVDLCPPGRIDEEAEHVMLPAIQAGSAFGVATGIAGCLRPYEVRGEHADHREQVRVVQPGVARPTVSPVVRACSGLVP